MKPKKPISKLLYPYQKEGVQKALEAFDNGEKGFIIGDEMGLGKSIQALAIIDKLSKKSKSSKNYLIICPAGLLEKWKDEIKKFLPAKRKYSIILKSYNALTVASELNFVTKSFYDLTVCDEVHAIQNFSSLRTRAILGAPGDQHKRIANASKRLLGLSGTWPSNKIGETYPFLLRITHPLTQNISEENFIKKWAISYKYFNGNLSHKGIKNPAKFRDALTSNYIYRTLNEVAPQIPNSTNTQLPIECNAELYQEEKKLLEELLELAGHPKSELEFVMNKPGFLDLLLKTAPGFDKLAEFRKRVGLVKVKPVFDYLKECAPKKFILYTYHRSVALKYFELFQKEKKENLYLVTGDDSVDNRFSILKEADNKSDSILIATIDSCKEGFDLIGFNHTFFSESDYRIYAIQQAAGRTRRIGQKLPTFYYFFFFNKGIEKQIFKIMEEKKETLKLIRGK